MNITSSPMSIKLDSSLNLKSKDGLRYHFNKPSVKDNIFNLKLNKRKLYTNQVHISIIKPPIATITDSSTKISSYTTKQNLIPSFKRNYSNKSVSTNILGINDSFTKHHAKLTALNNVTTISTSFLRSNSQKSLNVERDKSASKIFKKIEDLK
jgi:hypothetical protein